MDFPSRRYQDSIFAFYHDTTAPDLRLPTTGIQGREAPNMLVAMGIGAFFLSL